MVSVLVAVFSVFAFSVWAKLYWHQEFEIIFNARTCSVSTFPKCIFRFTLHNIYTKAIVDVKICLILRDKNDFSCLDIVVMVCVCMCVCMRARVCELRYYCQPLSSMPASWRLSQMFEWSITMKNSHIAAPFFVHECWNYFSDISVTPFFSRIFVKIMFPVDERMTLPYFVLSFFENLNPG